MGLPTPPTSLPSLPITQVIDPPFRSSPTLPSTCVNRMVGPFEEDSQFNDSLERRRASDNDQALRPSDSNRRYGQRVSSPAAHMNGRSPRIASNEVPQDFGASGLLLDSFDPTNGESSNVGIALYPCIFHLCDFFHVWTCVENSHLSTEDISVSKWRVASGPCFRG
ncbi:unnamed protein product [Protopolystoma xenopodis]|uniref:Uncharacterized protein n=1 Tax=Protopolystoma xenopodis TaxID=117903 RepID=A0A3S5FEH8_9PLAT|nr:unnamed protein product [Protopolystoma xenopodis]